MTSKEIIALESGNTCCIASIGKVFSGVPMSVDVMQGFIVTSYNVSVGEAKKGFVMDEENDDDVSSFDDKAIAGWKTWEEQ